MKPGAYSLVFLRVALGVSFLLSPATSRAEEDEPKEEEDLTHCSPDKKFCMRTVLGEGEQDIREISLVEASSGKAVAPLLPGDDAGTTINDIRLIWPADSQWCAFYYAHPRVGYSSVLRLVDGAFRRVDGVEELRTTAADNIPDASVRNEYVRPVRWLKPGTLLLEQISAYRSKSGTAPAGRWALTARYDAKADRFKIVGTRKSKLNEFPDRKDEKTETE